MSEERIEPLAKKEYDLIGRALLELVSQFPGLPEDVPIRYQSIESTESIGIFNLPGAKYLRWYVDGGFMAQVSFQVAYKSFPTTNNQRINSQALVDDIMAWLENTDELPALTGGRTITKITASNSLPYKDATGEDKSITFAADAVMEYKMKGVFG